MDCFRHCQFASCPVFSFFTLNYPKTRVKNCSGVKILMSLKGFKMSRPLSPVIMNFASPLTASSRYLLSFGSRQTRISSKVSFNSASLRSVAKNAFLPFSSKYLLNFLRLKTLFNSSRTGMETLCRHYQALC